jgi:hypothetical protein
VRIVRPEALALALALCVPAAAGAAELGTLFHSPEERARLEKLRRGEAVAEEAIGRPSVKPEVTGFVRRSDGRGTVWINGVPIAVAGARADALMDPAAVRAGDEATVRIERGKPAEVKR